MRPRRAAAPGRTATVILGSVALAVSIPLLYRPTSAGWSLADMIRLQGERLLEPVLDGELAGTISRNGDTVLVATLVLLLVVIPLARLRYRAAEAVAEATRRQHRLREERREGRRRDRERSRRHDSGAGSRSDTSPGGPPGPRPGEESVPVPESLARGLEIPGTPGEDPALSRTSRQLRALAAQHQLPWRPEYATPGGARVMLEILRLRGAGIDGPGRDPEPAPPSGQAAVPDATPVHGSVPVVAPYPASASVPDPGAAPIPDSAAVAPDTAAAVAPDTAAAVAPAPPETVSTPGPEAGAASGGASLGSVYTSTTLYESSSYISSVTPPAGTDTEETPDPGETGEAR